MVCIVGNTTIDFMGERLMKVMSLKKIYKCLIFAERGGGHHKIALQCKYCTTSTPAGSWKVLSLSLE